MHPIRHIRKHVLRISQADMATVCGVTQATVSRWERGTLSPNLLELERIRAAGRKAKGWKDSLFFAPKPSPALQSEIA